LLSEQHSFNGNILVAEKGEIVYQKSFGFANIEAHLLNTDSSAFQIGSLSKTFTATAVLQLKEKGKLKLQDSFVKYFPEFPYPDITTYQLLTHTSGLPDKEELFFQQIEQHPEKVFTNNDIIAAIHSFNRPPAFVAGSQWRYNNIGYALLAMLVEKVSGLPFATYLNKHIFLPAGMTQSYLLNAANSSINSQVTGYLIRSHYLGDLEPISQSKKVRPWSYNMRAFEGPTNIISTTRDLLRFDDALRNNKLLKRSTLQEAFTPSLLSGGMRTDDNGEFGKTSYGLGWFIPADTTAGKIVMHTGREPGFFTFFLRNLSKDQAIIIMDNTEGNGFGGACKETFNLLNNAAFFPPVKYKQSLFLAYTKALYKNGADNAITLFNQFKTDTATYFMDERELNELGLELLNDRHYDLALEALKLCTILYPGSWNTYDSYGKALYLSGKKQEAILMYEKSIAMNPRNEPGKKMLALIMGK